MTLKQAKVTLAAYQVRVRHRDGEYRVCMRGCPETCAYYTDNLEDAVATGKLLSRHLHADIDEEV